MTKDRLTTQRVDMLRLLAANEPGSKYGAVALTDIIAKTGKKRSTVAKLLCTMHREGMVTNPVFGYWRATENAKNLLKGLKT